MKCRAKHGACSTLSVGCAHAIRGSTFTRREQENLMILTRGVALSQAKCSNSATSLRNTQPIKTCGPMNNQTITPQAAIYLPLALSGIFGGAHAIAAEDSSA